MGEELTQGRLAELSGLDKTTMVATIDELEREGLAERRPAPHDRRARVIAVTPKGEEVVARGREIVGRVQEEILGELPEEQREVFVGALARLVDGGLGMPAACEQRVRRPVDSSELDRSEIDDLLRSGSWRRLRRARARAATPAGPR